jgi:hypothetical protein
MTEEKTVGRNAISSDVAIKAGQPLIYEDIAIHFDRYGFYAGTQMIHELLKNGFKISWLNVAQDFTRIGQSKATILSRFREINQMSVTTIIDIDSVEKFLSASYEESRPMLFDVWFNSDVNVAKAELQSIMAEYFVSATHQTNNYLGL